MAEYSLQMFMMSMLNITAPPVLVWFYFLKECLVDIDLALSLNFPSTSEYKLYRRQACCFAQQGNRARAVNGMLISSLWYGDLCFVTALETAERKLTSCASLSQAKKGKCTLYTFSYIRFVYTFSRSTHQGNKGILPENRIHFTRLSEAVCICLSVILILCKCTCL